MGLPLMAAIVYEDGPVFDRFAHQLARQLKDRGLRLAGVVQNNAHRIKRGQCDMILQDLASGHRFMISQDRGEYAKGCRLDVSALLEASVSVAQALSDETDLLLINKFGKTEAEGGGLRDVIAQACLLGIPTIIGVPARNLAAWQEFSAGEADHLPPDPIAINHWLQQRGQQSS